MMIFWMKFKNLFWHELTFIKKERKKIMITKIKETIREFANEIDQSVAERERKKAENNGRFLPDVAAVENEKIDAEYQAIIEPIRTEAKQAVDKIIMLASSYIRQTVANIDIKALTELNALKGLELSEDETKILKVRYKGNYWALRMLSGEETHNRLDAAAVLKDAETQKERPRPDVYFEIFGEISEKVAWFIDNYDGAASVASTNPDIVQSALFLNGGWLDEAEERLNYNPAYFTTFDPVTRNTAEETAQLEKLFAGMSETQISKKINEMYMRDEIQDESELFDILNRSPYKGALQAAVEQWQYLKAETAQERKREEENRKWSEKHGF